MGLEESKLRRNVRGVLNYAQLLLSVVAVIWYPFWIAGGYLSDCWIGPVDWLWDLCIPVYVPVTVAFDASSSIVT